MVTRYSDAQLTNIQNAAVNNVPKDARSIWFDLQTLKKFLYQIEYNASKNPSKIQNKSLGVRIYYAAYPENDKMRQYSQTQAQGFSFNPNYEKLHTLVMIPTITDRESDNHYDFNPLDVNSYVGFVNMDRNNKFAFINSNYPILTLGPGAEETTNAQGISSQVSARNHGSLTPPDTFEGLVPAGICKTALAVNGMKYVHLKPACFIKYSSTISLIKVSLFINPITISNKRRNG